mmetsp:Transcript_32452/g.85189  ORF Transcript_32452/g.85189 Transcript_32452/m.85189 type:complete len:267 (+) Transcript_32452:105-905(+)
MQGTPGGILPQVQAPVPQAMEHLATPTADCVKPRQFTLADGRMLYVEAQTNPCCYRSPTTGGVHFAVYAHRPRTPRSYHICFQEPSLLAKCCPLKGSNTSIERRTWYEDADGMLMLRDGRHMYCEKPGNDDASWVMVAKPGDAGRNVDPTMRIPASAIGANGVICLANGRQLYVNSSIGRAATTKENKNTNKDPQRRQWSVSMAEIRERSKAEIAAREAAYYLGMLPVGLLICCCMMGGGSDDDSGTSGNSNTTSASSYLDGGGGG